MTVKMKFLAQKLIPALVVSAMGAIVLGTLSFAQQAAVLRIKAPPGRLSPSVAPAARLNARGSFVGGNVGVHHSS